MTIRENGEDTMPGIPPRGRRRDVLDDGEDVTACSDRELLLRVANASLAHDHGLGVLAREVAGVNAAVSALTLRLAPGGEIEHRARQTSSHAIEGFADSLSQKVVAAVKDDREGSGNITPQRVSEIVQKTLTTDELNRLRGAAERASQRREAILRGVAIGLITSALGGVGGYVVHALTSHPATTQRP